MASSSTTELSNREYWILTEVFVYLHGSDECGKPDCEHCKFLEGLFDGSK